MNREDLVKELSQMEEVFRQQTVQLENLTRAREQQSGAIQYARLILERMDKGEEEKKAVPVIADLPKNSVPAEEL